MDNEPAPYTVELERASRRAAVWHRGQSRRTADVPYVQHVTGVALILARLGYETDVLAAALLHDAVEDTEATLERIEAEFGPRVAGIVAALSERKLDEHGRKRPWLDRKTEHLAVLASSTVEARAVALADKLHNLTSILVDLQEGRPVWVSFHADRDRVLWYYGEVIERCRGDEDARLCTLAAWCRRVLADVVAAPE